MPSGAFSHFGAGVAPFPPPLQPSPIAAMTINEIASGGRPLTGPRSRFRLTLECRAQYAVTHPPAPPLKLLLHNDCTGNVPFAVFTFVDLP